MSYIKCKCGVKLNTEEVNTCPVCEDRSRFTVTNKSLEEKRLRKREYFKNYVQNHREYFREKGAIWRKKNAKRRNEQFKIYYQEHKEYYRQKGIEYRAKMKGINFSHVLV